jgi:phytoene dehydrogenase-like protein
VVSNADPEVTFRRLIGGGLLSAERRRQLDRCPWSVSCLSLFATAHLDPAELGLGAANYWILHDPDPERAYALGELERLERLPYVMVSVPSLKDPSSRRSGLYPIEAFALVPHAPFADWSATTHGHRPEGYLRLKEHLRRLMLRAASRLIPGLEERVDFCELGTPLTNAHFCAATRGAIYGVERAVDQPPGLDATCEFEGLYLAGSSTSSHGVFGAARSGVEAAAAVLGLQVESLLQSEGPPLELLDPRAPEDWPARWQQKLRPSDASA